MKGTLPVLYAFVSALLAFIAALLFERGLIRLAGLDLRELEWISDVVLAVAFGAATFLWLHLRRARAALTRLERAQVVLDTELTIASDIQHGLLPSTPPARDGWRFAARLEPAGHIGGDFYDFVDRGRSLLVLLADVSGKGIPAALVMASARALFRQIARDTDRPDELLTRLGRFLWEEHGGTPYLTAFLAHLDLDARSLSWVNAGHPATLLVAGTTHRALGSTGPPAGLLPDVRYAAEELPLAPGGTLVLVTDGVTEALEAGGRAEERIAWTVAQRRDKGPQAVCDRVMRLAASGRGPVGAGDWSDDRTVVAVTVDEA
ncbi:MAG TPA: PP2C family protein-serine/threonine phosphatase [Vicinamibacteria bacterium]|nr:PP2C family protein-serine/threonine phosphatase [Vicinamibacteria bacterium]